MLTEKQMKKAWQVWQIGGRVRNNIYAVYDAGMADGAAQVPVQVTLEEAKEIAKVYYGGHGCVAPSDTTYIVDMQNAVNTVLSKRQSPTAEPMSGEYTGKPGCLICGIPITNPAVDATLCQEHEHTFKGPPEPRRKHTISPSTPLVVETPVAAPPTCSYCGPVCYGGAEHNARVEEGDRKESSPEELVAIAVDAYNYKVIDFGGAFGSYSGIAAAINAIRPQIEAAAREGYVLLKDVEKAIRDQWKEWEIRPDCNTFIAVLRSCFTPMPVIKEPDLRERIANILYFAHRNETTSQTTDKIMAEIAAERGGSK